MKREQAHRPVDNRGLHRPFRSRKDDKDEDDERDKQAVRQDIHTDPATGSIQFFANQTAALGAFSFPFGGDTGTRNPVHGPSFMNLDIAVSKNFTMPWSEHHLVQFRWEAFNVLNHPAWGLPNTTLTSPQFGQITSTNGTMRQMQFALKYVF